MVVANRLIGGCIGLILLLTGKALGLCDREYPDAVFSIAYKDPASFNETPSCQTSIFQYKNFHIEWAQQVAYLYNRNQGVAWVGSKATLVCNREGYELIPEKTRDGILLADKAQLVGKFEDGGVEAHATNWCKCILNKSIETNSPIEKGAFGYNIGSYGQYLVSDRNSCGIRSSNKEICGQS